MKCMKLDHAVLSFVRTSFGKGGSKKGSFGEGLDRGEAMLGVRLAADQVSPSPIKGAWGWGDVVSSSDPQAVSDPATEGCLCFVPGGSGAGRKRLLIPLEITPGWMPKNGVSKFIVPKIRWKKGWPVAGVLDGFKATSAAKIPPMLWPSKTISVPYLVFGCNLNLHDGKYRSTDLKAGIRTKH